MNWVYLHEYKVKKMHYNQSEVTGMNLGNYRLHNSFTYD
jgi:hypothetical protein